MKLQISCILALALFSLTSALPSRAQEVLEVKQGQELILEPMAGYQAARQLGALPISRANIVAQRRHHALAGLEQGHILAQGSDSSVWVDSQDLAKECARYTAAGYRCSPNVMVSIQAAPNDTYYGLLYGLELIAAPTAWATSTGAGVLVAVIDTGVKYNHEDLTGNVAINSAEVANNSIDDDNNGYVDDVYGLNAITYTGGSSSAGDPMDDNGHGTHVSGTIAALGNNSKGIIGVAYGAQILAVKALAASGSGSISDVVEGIDYAIARGADILNLSLGTSTAVPALEASLERAAAAGIVIVAAAGNDGRNIETTPSYPASYTTSTLISVAATGESDTLAYFSNFGGSSVDVAAPGEGIASTYYTGSYVYLDGTSMATPHVAGVAALVKSANPSLSAATIRSVILNTVDPVSSLSGKVSTGGRINASAAVASALSTDPGSGGTGGTESYALSISSRKASAKATFVVGSLTDASSEQGVASVSVTLVCKNKSRGTKLTNSSGQVSFSVKRPAAGKANLACHLVSEGLQSRTIRVRALK
jgi:thermitase